LLLTDISRNFVRVRTRAKRRSINNRRLSCLQALAFEWNYGFNRKKSTTKAITNRTLLSALNCHTFIPKCSHIFLCLFHFTFAKSQSRVKALNEKSWWKDKKTLTWDLRLFWVEWKKKILYCKLYISRLNCIRETNFRNNCLSVKLHVKRILHKKRDIRSPDTIYVFKTTYSLI
jgi:hypothetical protein